MAAYKCMSEPLSEPVRRRWLFRHNGAAFPTRVSGSTLSWCQNFAERRKHTFGFTKRLLERDTQRYSQRAGCSLKAPCKPGESVYQNRCFSPYSVLLFLPPVVHGARGCWGGHRPALCVTVASLPRTGNLTASVTFTQIKVTVHFCFVPFILRESLSTFTFRPHMNS